MAKILNSDKQKDERWTFTSEEHRKIFENVYKHKTKGDKDKNSK